MRVRMCAPILLILGLSSAGCDRNFEPFDPSEEPEEPDLSRIMPEGARQAPTPGLPPSPQQARTAPRGAPPVAAESGPPIEGTVRLASGLEGRVPAGAVLFIIARRGDAGPPLAVKRIREPGFPLDFTLGPEDRMIQSIPFAGPLRISARVDSDGNAMSRNPGDMSGAAGSDVQPGARGVDVVIDQVL
jgi:cytochrome c-type biogenesis protein CcmH